MFNGLNQAYIRRRSVKYNHGFMRCKQVAGRLVVACAHLSSHNKNPLGGSSSSRFLKSRGGGRWPACTQPVCDRALRRAGTVRHIEPPPVAMTTA